MSQILVLAFLIFAVIRMSVLPFLPSRRPYRRRMLVTGSVTAALLLILTMVAEIVGGGIPVWNWFASLAIGFAGGVAVIEMWNNIVRGFCGPWKLRS